MHFCVVWEGFRGVLERLFVDFVQIFAVRYLVLKGVVFVSEDVGLLAEIVHELQLDLSLLEQALRELPRGRIGALVVALAFDLLRVLLANL